MNRKELLRDIMGLDKALDDFLADLRTRASWDKSNIDDDGTVALPCGIGVLHRLGIAREQLGKHAPLLATPAPPVDETDRLRESVLRWRDNLVITRGSPVAGDALHGAALDFVIEQLTALADRTQEGEVRRG